MSKNNLLEEIDNLANTCLDFNLESIEEILKDRKSFQSLSKIKVEI